MSLGHRGTPIKISGVSHPLEGFYKGLGVVKGEGVASAKKRPPSHLKKRIFLQKPRLKPSHSLVLLTCEVKNRWAAL